MKPIGQTDFYQLFQEVILSTDCRQRNAISVLKETLSTLSQDENPGSSRIKVLDFGCGASCPRKTILENMGLAWTGVDIESENPAVIVYNGINLPFPDGSFDIVFSAQVLEHLQKPDQSISEVSRVIRKGGYFVGSVSQLEPFHAMSTYNMTPLGLKLLLEGHDLKLNLLAPGIDFMGLTLLKMLRGAFDETISGLIGRRFWESESPLNRLFNIAGRLRHMSIKEINIVKLKFAGHFSWVAKKV